MNSIEITLGGEKRRLKFNQGALEVYRKKMFSLPVEMLNTGVVYACIYAGLIGNSYVTGVDFVETYETVCDWVDEANKEELKKTCDLFASTNVYKETEKETIEAIEKLTEEEKKNVK